MADLWAVMKAEKWVDLLASLEAGNLAAQMAALLVVDWAERWVDKMADSMAVLLAVCWVDTLDANSVGLSVALLASLEVDHWVDHWVVY